MGEKLREGDKVEANYRGRGKYYPGRIGYANRDGTYAIDYDDGEEIVTEGAIADAFFLILAGEAAVRRGDQQVATLGEGDYFGEIALLDPSPRTASVAAVGELDGVDLLDWFDRWLRQQPDAWESRWED